MDVYWLERSAADLPAQNDWLSASDRTRLDGMRFAKRRDDWRLGRWTAKLAVAAYLNLPTDLQVGGDRSTHSAIRCSRGVSCKPTGGGNHLTQSPRRYRDLCRSGFRRGLGMRSGNRRAAQRRIRHRLLHAGRTGVGRPGSHCRPFSTVGSTLERQGKRAQSTAHRAPSRYPIGSRQPSARSSRFARLGTHRAACLRRLAPAPSSLQCRSPLSGLVAARAEPSANPGRCSIPFAADFINPQPTLLIGESVILLSRLFSYVTHPECNEGPQHCPNPSAPPQAFQPEFDSPVLTISATTQGTPPAALPCALP